ncbi:hypothetical protein T484DRAFT_1800101 [Baffinella frigidus]|nr:hypothetical protein T484DRAFT_1800101 [Cryptophyta sp. CCMP2293]
MSSPVGTTALSDETAKTIQSISTAQVPASWRKVSHASHQPLGAWFLDLLARVEQLERW